MSLAGVVLYSLQRLLENKLGYRNTSVLLQSSLLGHWLLMVLTSINLNKPSNFNLLWSGCEERICRGSSSEGVKVALFSVIVDFARLLLEGYTIGMTPFLTYAWGECLDPVAPLKPPQLSHNNRLITFFTNRDS